MSTATAGCVSITSQLLEATLPYLYELHLKNTDAAFNSTFGFTRQDRQKGIIDVAPIPPAAAGEQRRLPVQGLAGYLEIGGPKLGRDYCDPKLEARCANRCVI